MDCKTHPHTAPELPEYLTKSVGPPAYGDIALRLRDMAAFLAAQGMPEVAEHVSSAYGCLRAKMASAGKVG